MNYYDHVNVHIYYAHANIFFNTFFLSYIQKEINDLISNTNLIKNNIKENGDSKSTMRNWETSFFGNYNAICINKLLITKICNKKEEREKKKKVINFFVVARTWNGQEISVEEVIWNLENRSQGEEW